MKRILFAVGFTLLAVAAPALAWAQSNVQALVDRSTLAIEDMMAPGASDQAQSMLQRARAVLVCPQVFEAGFIVGGSGGKCVLVARAANGTWSYPAFYSIGSASVGLQLGLKDSEIVLMVMTNRGLDALLASQFKFGADASAVVATVGGGVQGATTTAAGADIVGFTKARGAFVGLSLQGSVLTALPEWDQAYYGRPADASAIVLRMAASNPGADPLREVLTRYGSTAPAAQAGGYGSPPPNEPPPNAPPPGYGAPGYAPPAGEPAGGQPVPLAPGTAIQQQSLPPPSR
jgi:SH3 domain-containing YSC84-like protein 1